MNGARRVPWRTLVALVCLVASAPAFAKPEGKDAKDAGPRLRYARSYAEAMTEARDRGCVIFATVHEDG